MTAPLFFAIIAKIIPERWNEEIKSGGNIMDRLMLVLPTEQHKQTVWDYREEFLRNQDSMDGTGALQTHRALRSGIRITSITVLRKLSVKAWFQQLPSWEWKKKAANW